VDAKFFGFLNLILPLRCGVVPQSLSSLARNHFLGVTRLLQLLRDYHAKEKLVYFFTCSAHVAWRFFLSGVPRPLGEWSSSLSPYPAFLRHRSCPSAQGTPCFLPRTARTLIFRCPPGRARWPKVGFEAPPFFASFEIGFSLVFSFFNRGP